MSPNNLLCRWRLWAILLVGVVGCAQSEPEDDRLAALDPALMVPVSGVITINGKPRATVVITFLPPTGLTVATAETDQDGKYQLKCQGRPGARPGDYKVAISYLTSDQGEPQGLGPRGSMIQPPGMLTAKEQLPPEYSDLGRTKLSAKIGPQGDQFNFDVPASIPDAAVKPAEKKAAEGNSTEKKTAETKKG